MIGGLFIVGIRTCSLGRVWGSRQRKLANPAIRKGWLNDKKIFALIRPLSIAGFQVFVTDFFLFFPWLYFAICSKNLLVQLSVIFVDILLCPYWIRSWHLLRGEIKQEKDWFIVHLGIVVSQLFINDVLNCVFLVSISMWIGDCVE